MKSVLSLIVIFGFAIPNAAAEEIHPSQPRTRTVFGEVSFSALLQAWYLSGSGTFDDQFKLRRTELKLAGVVSPAVKWTLMVDPAKALAIVSSPSGRRDDNIVTGIVQDVFLTL